MDLISHWWQQMQLHIGWESILILCLTEKTLDTLTLFSEILRETDLYCFHIKSSLKDL